MKDSFYPYLDVQRESDPNFTVSGMEAFLMSFDKEVVDVFDRYTARTKEMTDRAAEVQKQSADTYKQNAENFGQ